ncbi:nucleoside monophosphate kinase [Luteimonas sp. MHLX1A]|uniref:nucleoside monophosphate kinase n=1 Tax=Alterluteimonas muca TaxID=2878684 RepID=UPI001E40C853|nr:nucleoside monophosphate kinase [Luteimonas sp. MHLX1A]MCD9046911.1 nucleoside monophosphate kinase [Luteimonas sp. MHLX1A]
MDLYCVMGPPGAGKTTQAALLAAAWGLPHVSAGEVVRDAKAAGERVPRDPADKALAEPGWIVERLRASAGAVPVLIIDGFPRHVGHLAVLPHLGTCRALIRLVLPYELAISRMRQRGREGEDLGRISHRRFLYDWREKELLAAAATAGIPRIDLDGDRGAQVIQMELQEALRPLASPESAMSSTAP